MDIIGSAEFRKTYPRLERPTKVTVNGHVIGTWTPGGDLNYNDIPDILEAAFAPERTHTGHRDHPNRRMTQAERDAILRRVNKGG